MATDASPTVHYRTVWISDVHLGARGANAALLLSFIHTFTCEKLYIVGDFIDAWQLRKRREWPQDHNDLVQRLLKISRKGVPIVYIPGNHDDFALNFKGVYGNISIVPHDVHIQPSGRRILVMHGHEFDSVTMHAEWLAVLGDIGYNILLQVSAAVHFFQRVFGLPHWSLSAYVKRKMKNAVSYISNFEHAVVKFASMHQAQGIVCGHIHTAAMHRIGEIDYYNCGDWVESCTALVEHGDGRMELVLWRDLAANRLPIAQIQPPEAHD